MRSNSCLLDEEGAEEREEMGGEGLEVMRELKRWEHSAYE